jgi:3-phosphoshikimate 1-carboxyvinyltransferase
VTIITINETAEIGGALQAPPSKSYTHRGIIAASLSDGTTKIYSPLFCDDTLATIKACASFGIAIKKFDEGLVIEGSTKLKAPSGEIDCRASGSTIRFLTSVAAFANGKTILSGRSSLNKRPIDPLLKALRQLGVQCCSDNGFPPITVFNGGIKGGTASLEGDISSQFITSLLLACPMAEKKTQLRLITSLESKPYVELTLSVIRKHGIRVNASPDLRRFEIPSRQKYRPHDHHVPGDFSSAACLLAAATVTNSHIKINDLSLDQPDSEIIHILRRMGIEIKFEGCAAQVFGGKLKAINIDIKDVPDLVPICAVLACFADGTTKLSGGTRLRFKETDRLITISSELKKMGANIMRSKDDLIIKGPSNLKGTTVNSHNDHRIAMACAVAALRAKGKTKIIDAESVNKSYPGFFSDLKKLGVKINVS